MPASQAKPAAQALLTEAVQHHRAGRLDDAERLYRSALELRPDDVLTLYNLGIALATLGRQDQAIACYRRALEINPHYAEAYNNLGILLAGHGRLDEAIASYRAAVGSRPDYPEAHNNLGIALKAQGRLDDAVACFRSAIDLRRDYPDAENNFGNALREQGRPDDAIVRLRRAIELRPAYPEAYNNLGIALKELGRLDEAAACYRRALDLKPAYPEAHNNMGIAFKEQGRLDDAMACYRRALDIDPNYKEAHNNLGITLQKQGRMDDAVACYRRAMSASPDFPQTYNNVGTAMQEQGRLDEAAAFYRQAIALRQDYPEAHSNAAMVLLMQGDMEAGWQEHEWRWKTPQMASLCRTFTQPQWRGEPATGRTLLIHAEQGYGDTLQFCRYASLAAARGLRVIVQAPRPLVRLLRGLEGVDQVLQDGEELPAFDLHCPMLSLPLAFGTTVATIPSAERYLHADTAQVAAWRTRLDAMENRGPHIGLVWAGNSRNIADQRRSLSPDRLAPLFEFLDAHFFSLQKDAAAAPEHPKLTDVMHEMTDFADTAALIANLDLVISVDTAVAHLAAALGRPVWLLNRFDPCWRWLTGRHDSPWYPTLRLFRQPKAGDWDAVIEEVRAELQRFEPGLARMPDVQAVFAEAVQHHQGGRLADADRLYRQVLATAPRHADSLHLLGVISGQTGRHDLAIEMIRKSIAVNPNAAPYHTNLGISLRHQKRLDDAVACFRIARELTPDEAEAHHNLGIALQEYGRPEEAAEWFLGTLALSPGHKGAAAGLEAALRQQVGVADAEAKFEEGNRLRAQERLDEAIACYRTAIEAKPGYPDAHNNLGIALRLSGRADEAIACYRTTIGLNPNYAEAHNNLGIALQTLERLEEAAVCYRRAIDLKPDSPEAHSNLGSALWEQQRVDEAAACYRIAIALKPDHPDAHNNLGTALKQQGRLDEAVLHYRKAIDSNPRFAEAHNNLGTLSQEQGDLDAASASYRRAIELKPDYPQAHSNLAMVLLALGDMAAGWAEYEWRLKTRPALKAQRDLAQPRWFGQPAEGRTLLIHAEQGFGDTIQFCRYAGLAAERGLRVIMAVPGPLVRLLHTLQGIDLVVPDNEPLPDFDLHCPMLSLPLAMGTTLTTIPDATPYLHADATDAGWWKTRLAAMGNQAPRVGLVWAGSARSYLPAAAAVDRRRSIAPERLAPLFELAGPHFFSLQKGGPAAPEYFPLTGFMDEMRDFADTAALIASLDLVISADTAVAHLAAALGKPTWLLDRFDPCWRWLTNRCDSPWYPTLRLFRQPAPGDWDSVIDEVRTALRVFCANHGPAAVDSAPAGFGPDVSALFAQAVRHHQAGRLADAEGLYRQVLTAAPRHADSLHLLGVIGGQTGRHDLAVEMIRKAIAINPEAAPFHANLGVSFLYQKRLDEAAACFRAALDLTPNDPEANRNLGIALQEQGQLPQVSATSPGPDAAGL
jgi:tetratricopeptide (TPR) repeat protein